MKNQKERIEFINDSSNWEIIEVTPHVRVSRIEYKGEKRYRLETYEAAPHYDFETRIFSSVPRWIVKDYFKESEQGYISGFVYQSLTDIRNWISDLDKKKGKSE